METNKLDFLGLINPTESNPKESPEPKSQINEDILHQNVSESQINEDTLHQNGTKSQPNEPAAHELPEQLNYSMQAYSQTKHYQRFVPTVIGSRKSATTSPFTLPVVPSIHSHGFTPWVYSRRQEDLSNVASGYRRKADVIGLTTIGYIDIDSAKMAGNILCRNHGNHTPHGSGSSESPKGNQGVYHLPLGAGRYKEIPLTHSTPYHTPTVDNITSALSEQGLWHFVHPSASRKEGKMRVLYKRNLMAYVEGALDTGSFTWDLTYREPTTHTQLIIDPTSVGQNQGQTREPHQEIDTERDHDSSLITKSVPTDIQSFAENLIREETFRLITILERAGINFTGIDLTAIEPHMHSSHLTNRGSEKIPTSIVQGEPLRVITVAAENTPAYRNSGKEVSDARAR